MECGAELEDARYIQGAQVQVLILQHVGARVPGGEVAMLYSLLLILHAVPQSWQ